MGFRVWGLGFGVRVWGLGFGVWGWVLGLGKGVSGLGFGVGVYNYSWLHFSAEEVYRYPGSSKQGPEASAQKAFNP